MRKAIGFYWTLPVPWAGFTALPEDIDAAAGLSTTIRYQREVIRRHAKDNALELIAERVFLEISPDRASRHVRDALRPVTKLCQAEGAALLVVDFSVAQGWRSAGPLMDWAQKAGIEVRPIYPEAVQWNGQTFEPQDHFRKRRQQQLDWTAAKPERVARALEAARRWRAEGRTHAGIAEALEAAGLRSATGRRWSGEMVRQMLRAAPGDQPLP